jgi:DNA polymerase-3 subunit chi
LIEFHVLESSQDNTWLNYVATLAESRIQSGQTVLIVADKPALLQQVNSHLWTFRDDSFLPHELLTANQQRAPHIIYLSDYPQSADVIIHLGEAALTEVSSLPLIIDVIDADQKRRDAGRARFSTYRKKGQSPQTIKIPG